MSFSGKQMGRRRDGKPGFQDMVRDAWAAVCRENPGLLRCKGKRCGECSFCQWYEGELLTATGHASTTECNAGRDYDLAMAHFEGIVGNSIEWQRKIFSGDAKRVMHELDKVASGHGLNEAYLRAVAQRMLRLDAPPELHTLARETVVAVMGEVKRSLRREVKRAVAAGNIDVPF